MYTALYRSFRPETFEALLGQSHIVKILQNQIRTSKTGHAYLFCGTRGTGKTSTARILAKGVNCLADIEKRPCGICDNCLSIQNGTFLDVIEIDAASNNGVENVRELRESVKYHPASGRCKVYIIDEVHMLSPGAFNALLKTLEEPPESVMFILATTEPQKLPATILSRCLRLDFRRIPEKELILSMQKICVEIGVEVEESALALIAANADGSVRDGLSILDQCTSTGATKVTRSDIVDILGTAGEDVFIEITDLVDQAETAKALVLIDKLMADGKDVKQFLKDWIYHLRNLMLTRFVTDLQEVLNMSCENMDRVRDQGNRIAIEFINNGIMELSRTLGEAKWSTQPRTLLELAVIRLSAPALDQTVDALAARIATLEKAVSDGTPIANRKADTSKNRSSEIAAITSFSNMESANAFAHPSKEAGKIEVPSSEAAIGQKEFTIFEEEDSDEDNLDQTAFYEVVELTKEPSKPVLETGIQMESLWHAIFEDAEAQKSSFNLIRAGTKLSGIDDKVFYIEAITGPARDYAERNRKDLEKIVEKHIGRPMRMDCRLSAEKTGHKSEKTIEEIADETGKRLGIAIEIIE
jgi:DNA polymerase-3 subunit gamma/tau